MLEQFLTTMQLHALLKAGGHSFCSAEPVELPVDICPPTEIYLTVGLEADGTLRPAYRERYFACRRNADEEPLLLSDPTFALEGPFATVAKTDPGNNYFVMGPVRWLLARARRFGRVILWPRGGFRGADGLDFILTNGRGERTDQAPRLADWFQRRAPEPLRVGAIALDLSDLGDCRVIWEAANLVGEVGYDFYLSDPASREVYQLHHHDKVVISIPDDRSRRELLVELSRQTDVLEDCSGYSSLADEDLFES